MKEYIMDAEKKTVVRRGPFEISSDTRILYNVLEKGLIKEGRDIVSYKELSAAIGRDVQGEARGILGTARKLIKRQHKILLEAVTNEGIKKTEDYEGALDKSRNHIRRTARHTIIDVGQALNGQPINPTIAAKISTMNAMMLFAGPKIPQKLIDKIEQEKLKELSTVETLRLFLPEKKNRQEQ
jgi:hypothetical protein